jgi:hypothetical protein
LALLLLGALAIAWYRRRRGPRDAALRELARLRRGAGSPAQRLGALNALLKRYALVCWPRQQVAGLSGEAWLRFLDAHGGGGQFLHGPGRVLADAPYAPGAELEPAVFDLARRWIKANRPRRGR